MSGGSREAAGRAVPFLRAVVSLALAGAAAFGLWHLVVGGVINGNWRAGTFGFVLALVAGLPLIAGAWFRRRRAASAI